MSKKDLDTFEQLMNRFVGTIVLHLIQEFIVSITEGQFNMFTLYNSDKQLSTLSSGLSAIDVKFRHTDRSHGNQLESKTFYSGK